MQSNAAVRAWKPPLGYSGSARTQQSDAPVGSTRWTCEDGGHRGAPARCVSVAGRLRIVPAVSSGSFLRPVLCLWNLCTHAGSQSGILGLSPADLRGPGPSSLWGSLCICGFHVLRAGASSPTFALRQRPGVCSLAGLRTTDLEE